MNHLYLLAYLFLSLYSVKGYAAQSGYNCLIAGWPSKLNAKGKCEHPKSKNTEYSKFKNCSEGEILCNPSFFGSEICISLATQADRNSAFSSCQRLSAESADSESENFRQGDNYWDTVEAVNNICNKELGWQASTGMCQAAKIKLAPLVPDLAPIGFDTLNKELNHENDPDVLLANADKLNFNLSKDVKIFDKNCSKEIPPGDIKTGLLCETLAQRIKKTSSLVDQYLAKIDRVAQDLPKDQNSCSDEGALSSALTAKEDIEKANCEEIKKNDNFMHELECAAKNALSFDLGLFKIGTDLKDVGVCKNQSDTGCIQQIVVGFFKSIVNTFTGLWDVMKSAGKWGAKKAGEFWNWVKGVEDSTADAHLIASSMNDQEVKKAKKNLGEWVKEKFNAVTDMIKQFLTHDVMCRKWEKPAISSGECLQPADWNCLTSRDKINGFCTTAGYVSGELIGVAFVSGAVSRGVGQGVKALRAALEASGKFASLSAKLARVGQVISHASKVFKSTKFYKAIQKANLVVKAEIAAVKATPAFLKAAKISQSIGQNAAVKLSKKVADNIAKGIMAPFEAAGNISARSFKAGQNFTDKIISATTSKSLQVVDKASKASKYLSVNASESTRVEAASGALSREISKVEQKAIIDAHKVGLGEAGKDLGYAGLENYTKSQLREKVKILKDAGFSSQEIRVLMETGITGGANKVEHILKAASSNTMTTQQVQKELSKYTLELQTKYGKLMKEYRAAGSMSEVAKKEYLELVDEITNVNGQLLEKIGPKGAEKIAFDQESRKTIKYIMERIEINNQELGISVNKSVTTSAEKTVQTISEVEVKQLVSKYTKEVDFKLNHIKNETPLWSQKIKSSEELLNTVQKDLDRMENILKSPNLDANTKILVQSQKRNAESYAKQISDQLKNANNVIQDANKTYQKILQTEMTNHQEWIRLSGSAKKEYAAKRFSELNALKNEYQPILNAMDQKAIMGSEISNFDQKKLLEKIKLIEDEIKDAAKFK